MSETPTATLAIPDARTANAWLVVPSSLSIGPEIKLQMIPALGVAMKPGDAVLVVGEAPLGDITCVGRIYRIRFGLTDVTLQLDGHIAPSKRLTLNAIGVSEPTTKISRLQWPLFSSALEQGFGIDFKNLPVISGKNASEQAYLRRLLQLAVVDDLLGPANGPQEEVIGMSVRDRYLVGKLAPKTVGEAQWQDASPASALEPVTTQATPASPPLQPYVGHNEPGAEFNGAEGGSDPDENDQQVGETAANQSLVPSSIGFTFCIEGEASEIEIEARWGRYERGDSETETSEKTGKPVRAWKRIPSGGKQTVTLKEGFLAPLALDAHCPEVFLQGTVRPKLPKGDRLVTLFLVNNQTKPEESQDSAWVFQPEIIVRGIKNTAVFRRRPVLDADGHDPEREALEMVYRKRVEFAVGHGVSVHATSPEGQPEKAVEIRSVVMPQSEVEITETPGLDPRDRAEMKRLVNEGFLDMEKLANLQTPDLIKALTILTDDYGEWIKEQTARIPGEFADNQEAATETMARCAAVAKRLKEGIKTLESNSNALEAFRFANLAMARQRVREIILSNGGEVRQ